MKSLEELLAEIERKAKERMEKSPASNEAGATVYESNATVPESAATVYEGDATVLENNATVYDTATASPASASEPSYVKGEMLLGTYTVESSPIHGGMGSVWRVHHKGWNVDLAMKRPQAKLFQSDVQKGNFIEECKAWINLGLHPNIVSCYYVREIDGVPTIFSEWMENGSLENHIQKGTLYTGTKQEQQERLLDIAVQFARGLHYAHEQGLIHQDVKPDNVLLSKEWDAKVADFGLAKARAQLTVLEGENTVRDAGATIMAPSGGYTPAYCSMEQMDGKPLTRRTDIYSWAVSVMEMYLGERLWDNGVVAGFGCETYFSNCRVKMPEELKTLLKKCMAAEPEDRPHDFAAIDRSLTELYRAITGKAYTRQIINGILSSAETLNNRALSYIDMGQAEKALTFLDESLRINSKGENNMAAWNRKLLLWRSGKWNPEFDKRDVRFYDAPLLSLETGDIFNAYCGFGSDDNISASDNALVQEYKKVKDDLKASGRVRCYQANAGYICGNKLLLAYDAETVGEDSVRMELRDADTDEILLTFDNAPAYEFKPNSDFVPKDCAPDRHPFTAVGSVCLSKNGKYAFAMNAELYHNREYTFGEHTFSNTELPWELPVGIHVWDAETGWYIKYLDIRHEKLYPENLRASADGTLVTAFPGKAINWKTEEMSSVSEEDELIKREWTLENGYKIEGYSSLWLRSPDGELISKFDGLENFSVEPAENRVLTYRIGKPVYLEIPGKVKFGRALERRPTEKPRRPRDVTLWTLKPVEYKAPYLLAQIREARKSLSDYEVLLLSLNKVDSNLAEGKVDEAMASLQCARRYLNIGYDDIIREASWHFAGKAVPQGVFRIVPAREMSDRNLRFVAAYSTDRSSMVELKAKIPDDNENWISISHERWDAKEICVQTYKEKNNKSKEIIRQYTLPFNRVFGACVSSDELLLSVGKTFERRTSQSYTYKIRSGNQAWEEKTEPKKEEVCPVIFCRLNLITGDTEYIGKGICWQGVITFGGKYLFGYNIDGEDLWDDELKNAFIQASNNKKFPNDKISISDDGKLWMVGSELYYPEFNWVNADGEIPALVSVSDPEQWVRDTLAKKGIELFTDDQELILVNDHYEVKKSHSGTGKGFFGRLLGKK